MPDTIQIKAFGMIAEHLGNDILEIDNPGTTEALRLRLFSDFPELKSMKFTLALDKKIISGETDISQGKEIALLPPFSGG